MTEYATNVPAIPLMRHRPAVQQQSSSRRSPPQSPTRPVSKAGFLSRFSRSRLREQPSTDFHPAPNDTIEVANVDEEKQPRTPSRNSSELAESSSNSSESRNSTSPLTEPEDAASSPPLLEYSVPKQLMPLHTRKEIPIPVRPSSRSSAHSSSRAQFLSTRQDGQQQLPPQESSLSSPGGELGADDSSAGSEQTTIPMEATGSLHQEKPHKNEEIRIPQIPPINSSLSLPPNLAELATGLEGKFVDEFGNILDWNGQVLGRVEGDLPSMIGRSVSSSGEIIGDDGEVVGYVAENDTLSPAPPEPQPIEGQLGGGLKVDHLGNILDTRGNVVGHFTTAPLLPAMPQAQQRNTGSTPDTAQSPPRVHNCSCGRSQVASTPSPSEVYLDVKSTNDGIQIIIKIPTVFSNGGRPSIHIGG